MRKGNIWRIAVIDSGLAEHTLAGSGSRVVDSCCFKDDGVEVTAGPAGIDIIGHGTSVVSAICAQGQPVDLLIAQVLNQKAVTTAATVAAAVDWAVTSGAELVHMSLGLRENRRVLAEAVAAAVSAGCIVVASAPARGSPTFPSSYPHVIRATGDARCAAGEISALASTQADFGGCPGGASLGAAYVTGYVAANVERGLDIADLRERLTATARYHGIERRMAVSSRCVG